MSAHEEQHNYCCTQISNLNVSIGRNTILRDINIHLHCGQLTVIIGRNGAGKTTLVKSLLGEIKHSGNISFCSKHKSVNKLNIGYVPQKLNLDANSPTSVYDLFSVFLTRKPVFLVKNHQIYSHIKEQLAVFGAQDLIDKRLCDLSGGELQRVMLSIATTPIPELLLLDEPVSGIDKNGILNFYSKLNDFKLHNDVAILLISHDFNFLSEYADRVILLDRTVLKDGAPSEVLNSPEFIEIFGRSRTFEEGYGK